MKRLLLRKAALIGAALGATALSAEGLSNASRNAPQLPDTSCVPPAPGAAGQARQAGPVLVEGLGYAGIEPDSRIEEARDWFAQGVRFVWAFDEEEAIRAFQQAQQLDPACAMCFWGEAWARSPTINLRPRTEEIGAARTAAARAVQLAGNLGPRDRFLVQAMEARTKGSDFDDKLYASLMEAAALRQPGDDMVNVLAADARMVADPPNRFVPGSLSQRLLERVLARNRGHGGAIHFYIHLTDWIDRQHLAVPFAEQLGRIAPAASHLVHMPSHSFFGVGRYGDAAAANVAAISADRSYARRVNPPRSEYRWALMRHNMQFAINSALARGDAETALSVAEQYRAEYLSGSEVAPASRILGSAVFYASGLHADPAAVLAMPQPADGNAQLKVFRLYARGEALARRGDADAVRAEARAIAALRDGVDAPALGRGGAALAEIAQHVLEGRAAMLRGDYDAAALAYRKGMERQLSAGFGSDPPLFWAPVRRSLAAALIAKGDHEGARAQLLASIRRWPNDPLALYALSQADRALGDTQSAERNLARARSRWAGRIEDVPLARI